MHINAEHSVAIHRPMKEVFALISDATSESQWNPTVLKTEQITDGPVGVGTRYRETHRVVLHRENTVDFEVIIYEPDQRIGFKMISGPVRLQSLYTLEPGLEGTRVTLKGEAQVTGILNLLTPWLRNIARKQVVKSLTCIKHFLEDQSTAR